MKIFLCFVLAAVFTGCQNTPKKANDGAVLYIDEKNPAGETLERHVQETPAADTKVPKEVKPKKQLRP
jgi:hypothetical protein